MTRIAVLPLPRVLTCLAGMSQPFQVFPPDGAISCLGSQAADPCDVKQFIACRYLGSSSIPYFLQGCACPSCEGVETSFLLQPTVLAPSISTSAGTLAKTSILPKPPVFQSIDSAAKVLKDANKQR